MTNPPSKSASATAKPTAKRRPAGAEHLGQALRDNLRRRKAQAQARAAKADTASDPDTAKE